MRGSSTRGSAGGDAGYRRGMVLGLTMAELMLLLVFCLLIALAALLAAGREKLAAAERAAREAATRAEVAETALSELSLVETLARDRSPGANRRIDDTWRRLVRDGALITALEDAGLTEATLRDRREFLAAVAPLAERASAEEVTAAVDFARTVRARLGLRSDTPADVIIDAFDAARRDAEQARPGKPVDLPPILILREDRGYFFETGSAVPSDEFTERLTGETAGELVRLIADYDVDIVEVIGHTDERPVNNRVSNLDETLLETVRGGPVEAMAAADNAGLGLARAVAVAQVLRSDPRLAGHQILPMSAAQLVDIDGTLTSGASIGDVRERRRIEIRLRRATLGN
jgi:flagellar motor protein MotB